VHLSSAPNITLIFDEEGKIFSFAVLPVYLLSYKLRSVNKPYIYAQVINWKTAGRLFNHTDRKSSSKSIGY
jgi:hypothetical protein